MHPVATPSSLGPRNPHLPDIAPARPRAVVGWLLVCAVLVFAMVVVGGVTRLTHSGLSITEWQPIVGALPPLTEDDWQDAFAKYRRTPEYEQVNRGMELTEFKGIFWWEYAHRLLGRLIGVAFLVPFIYFVLRRRIPRGLGLPLLAIFGLGAMQGALGWYMVQSGLVDDPRVSQFRLTAHLGLALLIFASLLWIAWSIAAPQRMRVLEPRQRSARRWAFAVLALVFTMALSGGLVAGIRAGFAYNTFPLMHGRLVPPELWQLEPWWRNLFWNMATVQFDHRLLAWALALVTPIAWWKLVSAPGLPARARSGGHLLLGALALQITLGIATLVNVVPWPLAAAHQAGAVLLLAAALNTAHALR